MLTAVRDNVAWHTGKLEERLRCACHEDQLYQWDYLAIGALHLLAGGTAHRSVSYYVWHTLPTGDVARYRGDVCPGSLMQGEDEFPQIRLPGNAEHQKVSWKVTACTGMEKVCRT